jgi:adenine-specific DNA-methyltransferase
MVQMKVDSVKHVKAKRTNIPTEQMRDFMDDEERSPKKILYPRDLSLDPQLVWRGKDEQDAKDLEVPAVPIYIQEKIEPQVIIESLRDQSTAAAAQAALFANFNGISFEESVDFYRHELKWQNRMILGDSLLVMTSLAEKEPLKGKVQMIYFDPPYGIRFGSNWQVSTRKREVKDTRSEDVTRQPEQVKAFRDTWELGIHSYLSYLRDRLIAARELLTESGSIFIQIGDENAHLARNLLDEVFGSENFIANIAFKKKKMPLGETYIFTTSDYLIWYGKDSKQTKFRKLFLPRERGAEGDYNYVELPDGQIKSLAQLESPGNLPNGATLFQSMDMRSSGRTESCVFEFKYAGKKFFPAGGKSWKTNTVGMRRLAAANRLFYPGGSLRYKLCFDDYPMQELSHMWMDTQGATDKVYVVQTPSKVIERCILMTTDPGELVLDPTCGSGTTAFVAEQFGRRWITIDTSRVAMALARTRLMAAKYPYYILSDSPEGLRKEAELTGKLSSHQTEGDIRKGFVYRRMPHITLGSITNNSEIDEIYNRWQLKLEPLREKLNAILEEEWDESEIPVRAAEEWGKAAKKIHADWLEARQLRQKEINESIARSTESEMLYDQPYEDNRRIRVTGSFTVESLSPHRVLSTDEEGFGTGADDRGDVVYDFVGMIVENLKRAGVQNTKKGERLKFERLEPFAGAYVNAEGEYSEKGSNRRVAVCIGPQYGTVGSELIKEAAKEAVLGIGFDLLIVCGFAFEGNASEETKRYGRLPVLLAQMNPDLAMGDELLKKTGTGNLFTVFGEPDITIEKQKDGSYVAEIRGVDVYDPTTGQIRNSSVDDIACWFIDTDYNSEGFFVRHAYFTGSDEPYEKLKNALRADIDEAAWASLYSARSRPFPPPKSGKIAVKVINHFGDEVLKIYELGVL